ncbi:hypothetical protein [Ideonella sp.]|uniref:hypothetical protein n=1 Tax=Ideonella sp. TaxID=1929293 RepID=UPI0035AE61C4
MSWLDLPGAPAPVAAPVQASAVEAWADIFATHAVRSGQGGPGAPVVLTDSMRVLPLLESQGPLGWIHAGPLRYVDHVQVAHGQPAWRPRIAADQQPAEAVRLLRRAGLCLVGVPASRTTAQVLAGLAAHAVAAKVPMLVYGAAGLAGWAAFDGLVRQAALQPVEAGAGRAMASAGLAGLVGPAGLCDTERAVALAHQLSRSRQADLHVEALGPGRVQLRLRIDPVLLVAASAPTLAHHVANEGRALFNSRGLASLLLPWAAPSRVRLLLRNVRARIEGGEIAVGDRRLEPDAVDYTEHGAFLRMSLPGVPPGRDALLHLSLPRDAVPGDGFCDVGAAEFTVEAS